MKAHPIIKGDNDSRSYPEQVGRYGFVLVATSDRGKIMNVHFYTSFKDHKPSDTAIIKFDDSAW